MVEKKTKELSKEARWLKQLKDRAVILEEKKKRQAWVNKLVVMPDSVRDIDIQSTPETPQLFQDIAEKILEEGI
ncbi:hypothetical protein [Chlamydia sp. 17-3921]|uniref:hypothetical protein n=1 Tax=Chlamydia sp. 17-3921 TaxID=2675798 RepID=UPI001919BE46|nr:hypothetical protein [Chlamydia sp. 17-3921]